jgi:hypothetical protein
MDLNEYVLVEKTKLDNIQNQVKELVEKSNRSNADSSSKLCKTILNDKDVCEMLGISSKTLPGWRCQGKFPFYKAKGGPKGKCYYLRKDIEAYMLGVRHKSSAEISKEADKKIAELNRKRENKKHNNKKESK